MRQLQLSLALLGGLIAVGVMGYMLLADIGFVEALYMTVITLATVGFKEVVELDTAGMLFTTFLIVVGVGTAAWAISNAAEVMLGQTFWKSVQRRRNRDMVDEMQDHYIICGYGRLGRQILRDLSARGEQFVVVDWDEKLESELLSSDIAHIIDDATREKTLAAAGVERARGMVAALDDDAQNVLTVLTARELNPRLLIIARAGSEPLESKLLRAGADRVVSPRRLLGESLASKAATSISKDLGDAVEIAEDFEVVPAERSAADPGTVMTIDDTGALRVARHAYDSRVAGVVSGAGQRRLHAARTLQHVLVLRVAGAALQHPRQQGLRGGVVRFGRHQPVQGIERHLRPATLELRPREKAKRFRRVRSVAQHRSQVDRRAVVPLRRQQPARPHQQGAGVCRLGRQHLFDQGVAARGVAVPVSQPGEADSRVDAARAGGVAFHDLFEGTAGGVRVARPDVIFGEAQPQLMVVGLGRDHFLQFGHRLRARDAVLDERLDAVGRQREHRDLRGGEERREPDEEKDGQRADGDERRLAQGKEAEYVDLYRHDRSGRERH